MRKASLLTLLFTLLLAGAFVYAGSVQAQDKDEEADDADEEEVEEEDVDDDSDYEEEDVEEEDEADVEEEDEEIEEEEEDDAAEIDEEEEEDEEEAEEEEPEEEREPLPEFPGPGVPLTEGKWINVTFNGALVSQYLLVMENLKGESTTPPGDGKFRYDHSFTVQRILMGVEGDFWERRITFELLGDMGGLMRLSSTSGQDTGFLLDASVGVRPLVGLVDEAYEGLHIKFGRFTPGFGYYHVRNEAMLDVASHPLVVTAMMPGRQVGLEVEFAHQYFEIAVGVFNGMRYYASVDPSGELASSIWIRPGFDGATLGNVVDDNKGKDIMVRLTGKIPFGLSISGYLYMARPEFYVVGANHVVAPAFVYGGEAVYENLLAGHMRLKLVANFTGRTMTYPELAGGDLVHPTITQYGFLFHAGLKIGQWVEPVVRAEMWNGRASDYLSTPTVTIFEGQGPHATPVLMADGDTWEMWATGGLNFFLFSDHCRLTLLGTYIHRANDGLSSDFWLTAQAALVI